VEANAPRAQHPSFFSSLRLFLDLMQTFFFRERKKKETPSRAGTMEKKVFF
jgi:hypothetical protein